MTIKQLPSAFCWTKMGTESGEDLSSIILRKEWERRLGNGRFLWGIGQSLGNNAEIAVDNGGPLAAVFSPMPSKPKAIDVEPGEVVLWNSWVDGNGQVRPLPLHTFVTSRALLPSGRRKESHYALVCSSTEELAASTIDLVVPAGALRNVSTGKALGASQVTAVVSCTLNDSEVQGKLYPISFVVRLEAPYFVRLANPKTLKRKDVLKAAEISRSGDMAAWTEFVARLRISPPVEKQRGRTIDMFGVEDEPIFAMKHMPATSLHA